MNRARSDGSPIWHGLDGKERDPVRSLVRVWCPSASEGVVIEDLDLIVRYYGPRYGLDAAGAFALVEFKHSRRLGVSGGQERTFGVLHRVLSQSPESDRRYLGFFVVSWMEDEDAPLTPEVLADDGAAADAVARATFRIRRFTGKTCAWEGSGFYFSRDIVTANGWAALPE